MVKIKKLHPDAVLPEYQTPGAVGFDFHTVEEVTIKPRSNKLVRTGLAMAVPDGLFLACLPRSSTWKNFHCIVANSVGVIDNDYCGDEDEVWINLYNPKAAEALIPKGARFAQGLFLPVAKIPGWEEVETMGAPSRGGHGSTGV
jgi:dUTP pyrophosphatase